MTHGFYRPDETLRSHTVNVIMSWKSLIQKAVKWHSEGVIAIREAGPRLHLRLLTFFPLFISYYQGRASGGDIYKMLLQHKNLISYEYIPEPKFCFHVLKENSIIIELILPVEYHMLEK